MASAWCGPRASTSRCASSATPRRPRPSRSARGSPWPPRYARRRRRSSPGSARFPSAAARGSSGSGWRCPPSILHLQRACERAARTAGFDREERPFRAHLTLGRWRERVPETGPAAGRSRLDAARYAGPLPKRPAVQRRRLHPARAVPPGGIAETDDERRSCFAVRATPDRRPTSWAKGCIDRPACIPGCSPHGGLPVAPVPRRRARHAVGPSATGAEPWLDGDRRRRAGPRLRGQHSHLQPAQ